MCGNDGLQQVSGLFFPGMDTIPLRSLHAKGGVGRSSEKDRFLYTSFLIASRKRTRSDIYVVHTWGKKSGTAEYLSAANGEIFYPVFCRSE